MSTNDETNKEVLVNIPVIVPVVEEELVAGDDQQENLEPPEEKLVIEKRPPSTNTVQESEVSSPLEKDAIDDGYTIPLGGDTAARISAALNALPNVNIDDTESGNKWLETITDTKYTMSYGDGFQSTVTREGAAYRQTVPSERGKLSIGTPKFSDQGNIKLTGESAVLRVRALTGLGSIVQVPLWHSGFWITLKAPSESAMLELNRRFAEEKITLGRMTYGLAFANNSVFFAGWLMDFALSHVYETTLKPEIADSLRSRISTLDIPLIAWGLACVIWPRGFPYSRAVLDQTTEQNKIIREKINVAKCLWTDTASLTDWQVGHMAGRHGRNMTAESIDRYRNEFTLGKQRTIKLSDDLEITMRVPSLDQYLTSGQKWVNNIVMMVDKAFGLPPNDGVRDRYILDQGKATHMRQYSHWVESLSFGTNAIDDVDTLDQTFDALSTNDDIRSKFFIGIKKFIEDATMSVVAIPATEAEDKSDLPKFPHLLPLDALSVFFILLVQKVTQIQGR